MGQYVALTSGGEVCAAVAYGPATARCATCATVRGYSTGLAADEWAYSHWTRTGHPTEWVGG